MSAAAIGAAASAVLAVIVLAARLRISVSAARRPGTVEPARRRGLGPLRSRRQGPPRADDVADWCDHVARSLRSGSSLSAAVVEAADGDSSMSRVVAPVARQVRRGTALSVALERTAGRGDAQLPAIDPAGAAGLALTVLRSCSRFGGPAAAPLERAAMTLRAREAVVAELQVHSAQARLSARVLTLVPVALLAMLAFADDKVGAAVLTPAGIAAVSLGAVLNVAGSMWMRRIIGGSR